MKKILILCLLLPYALMAQKSDLGNWLIYFGNKKINERWNWHHEAQYRNFNAFGNTEQLLLRTGIDYNLTENNNNLHLGYGFVYSEPYMTLKPVLMSIGFTNNLSLNKVLAEFQCSTAIVLNSVFLMKLLALDFVIFYLQISP